MTVQAPSSHARHILGERFIVPEEVASTFGLTYTPALLALFDETLPNQDACTWCRDHDMILLPGPPTRRSLKNLCEELRDHFHKEDVEGYQDPNAYFVSRDHVAPAWIAIGTEPVKSSGWLTWHDQDRHLVLEPLAVPNIAELVWAYTVTKAVRRVSLPMQRRVRTSSTLSATVHVTFAVSENGRINVNRISDNYADDIALAGCRRF